MSNTTNIFQALILIVLLVLNGQWLAMLSDCLFGCCQCFWCSYFIRCIVPHFSSITCELFFAFVDLPTSVRSPRVRLLVVMPFSFLSLVFIFIGYCGSLEAFHISVSLICAAIWLTDSIFWFSKRVFVLFLSDTRAPSRILSILFCDLVPLSCTGFWVSFSQSHFSTKL